MQKKMSKDKGLSRRDFLKATTATVAAASISGPFVLARAADSEIRIGLTLTYSGVYGMVGDRVEKGIKLAFAQSAYKNQVKFFPEDTQGRPNVAIEKAQKLFEKNRVHMLAGPVAGHESLAVSEFLKPEKRLQLLAYGANINLCGKNCSRYTFLCCHTPWNQSAPAVDWYMKELGDKVFLIGADYSTGHQVTQFFREPFEKKGGIVVGSFFTPLGTTEFAPYLAKIKSAKPRPNGLFGFLGGTDLLNLTKQYYEFGLHQEGIPIIVGLGGFGSAFLNPLGEAGVGNYHVYHYSPFLATPENKAFREAYAQMFNQPADEIAMNGYEVGTMMVKGLEAAKGNPEDTETIIDGVEKIDYTGPRGHITMDPNHVAKVPIYIIKVVKKDGKYVHEVAAFVGRFGTPYGADGPGGACKMA